MVSGKEMFESNQDADSNMKKAIVVWNQLVSNVRLNLSDIEGWMFAPRDNNMAEVMLFRRDTGLLGKSSFIAYKMMIDATCEFSRHSVASCVLTNKEGTLKKTLYIHPNITPRGTIDYGVRELKASVASPPQAVGHAVHQSVANTTAAIVNRNIQNVMKHQDPLDDMLKDGRVVLDSATGQVMMRKPNGTYEPVVPQKHEAVWRAATRRMECACGTFCRERFEWLEKGSGIYMTRGYIAGKGSFTTPTTVRLPIALGLTDAEVRIEQDGDMLYVHSEGYPEVSTLLSFDDSMYSIVLAIENYTKTTELFGKMSRAVMDRELYAISCVSPKHVTKALLLSKAAPTNPEDVVALSTALTYHLGSSGMCFLCVHDSWFTPEDFAKDAPSF
jgi:hypothetical protein